MQLSQTTINFAVKRQMDATPHTVEFQGEEIPAVWIWKEDNEMEPVVIYLFNEDTETYTFHSHLLPQEIKEELPAHIKDERHLRQVIDFISTSIYK